MGNLKVHDKLDIQAGGQAEVLDEFGSGGQGTVYKVSYNGKTYALKWYHPGVFKGKEKDFYKTSKTISAMVRQRMRFSGQRQSPKFTMTSLAT